MTTTTEEKPKIFEALKCGKCGKLSLPPAFACPYCGGDQLSHAPLSGKAEVYTYTVVHMAFGAMAKKVPYTLAVVELQEGVRLMTIVSDADPAKIKIGDRVQFSHFEEGQGPIFKMA